MACGTLTKGRGLDCNRISGGIKNVYFAVYDQVASTTLGTGADLGSITDIDMGTNSIYKYVMPLGVASLTDTITGSRENGTIFYTPTINIILNRLTKEDQNQIKLLGATKTIIFAELNATLTSSGNTVIVCLGRVNGMELNTGTMDSGAAFGDRGGYTLTFDGLENEPFQMVKDYNSTPFDNADSGAQIPIVSV
tara:strand:- start:5591 stop:6172 length:582 start_codon:yes stop_codon:yes gene_type:complete